MAPPILNPGERITRVKEIEQDTADLLHSAALRLLRYARSADKEMDLDGPRASALSVLVFGGPLPLTRLAELEQVSPPAITKTVTALEAAGLATRTRSDRDRRGRVGGRPHPRPQRRRHGPGPPRPGGGVPPAQVAAERPPILR